MVECTNGPLVKHGPRSGGKRLGLTSVLLPTREAKLFCKQNGPMVQWSREATRIEKSALLLTREAKLKKKTPRSNGRMVNWSNGPRSRGKRLGEDKLC